MTDARALADAYFDHRQSTDLFRLFSFGQVDNLDRWEDVSSASLAERQGRLREFATEAESMLEGDMELADRILLDSIVFTARSGAIQLNQRTEQALVNPAFGFHNTLLTFIGRFALGTAEHGAAYLDKLRNLPALFEAMATELRASAADGRVALERHLNASATTIEDYLASATGADDPMCAQPAPTELDEAAAAEWTAERNAIVAGQVRPALAAHAAGLRELAAHGRSDDEAGIMHTNGGVELYDELVWSHTTLDLAPQQIHQIGLDQVAKLAEEYVAIAGPIFGLDNVEDILTHLRDEPSMKYQSGEDIVRDATVALERAAAVAPDWFTALPEAECTANEIPQGPLAFYSTPDPDTGKPGRFFFNTSEPSAWSTYQLEAVTFHESIPGHHLQLAIHAETEHLHPAQRRLGITAYLEGWGLYTERLADEMGLYSSELARVGMLAADSMRACRLVVDTGMHALGWSRQQAIDYMLANSPLSQRLVEGEIDRYIGMPGQALSYMIGRLELDDMRAEAAQNPDFDIRTFHDRVLAHGMVTLGTLREIVLAA
jgi:uncharacterized protein (DUF885 family)